jgi:molybdopterin-guanine dinucleotide biosynthesis protein A
MTVTGIILAGGKSTRMGQDKAFMQWNEKTFVQHVIDAAQPLCDSLIISGDNPKLEAFGHALVKDLRLTEGPVTALAGCFRQITTEVALVLSCDVPQITSEDLSMLIESHTQENDVTLYAYCGKQMPLVAVYNARCFPVFEKAFQNHQKKLFDVLNGLTVQEVEFNGLQGLHNINTLNDFAEL